MTARYQHVGIPLNAQKHIPVNLSLSSRSTGVEFICEVCRNDCLWRGCRRPRRVELMHCCYCTHWHGFFDIYCPRMAVTGRYVSCWISVIGIIQRPIVNRLHRCFRVEFTLGQPSRVFSPTQSENMSQPSPPSFHHLTDDVVDVGAVTYLNTCHSLIPAYFKNIRLSTVLQNLRICLNLLVCSPRFISIQ